MSIATLPVTDQEDLAAARARIIAVASALQAEAADPGTSAWVQASAGTGKTKVLTDRVLALLLAGADPARILCLTFTKAAAAEMANRISKRLGAWVGLDDAALDREIRPLLGGEQPDAAMRLTARRLFARVLDTPGRLKIQTIHAFCESLLGRFPIEAGVAPNSSVLDERGAAELLREARESLLRGTGSGAKELRADMETLARYAGAEQFDGMIAALSAERGRLAVLRDLAARGVLAEVLHAALDLPPAETPDDLDRAVCAAAATNEGDLRRVVAAGLAQGSKTDIARGDVIRDWLDAASAERQTSLDAYCAAFLTRDGAPRARLITAKALKACPDGDVVMLREAERLVAYLERRRAATIAHVSLALTRIGVALLERYETRKRRRAALDYDDLIARSRQLLAASTPWVLFKLDGGLDHILIDEAQDTNPDQWVIARTLTDEFFAGEGAQDRSRTLFVVGDAKQSIFSFQRADPAMFDAVRRGYGTQLRAAGIRWAEVPLRVSFRSTAAVLRAVDTVFETAEMAAGVAFDGQPIQHDPSRVGAPGLVEIWPLVFPEEQELPPAWAPPLERSGGRDPRAVLAEAIAAQVKDWLDQGTVLEATGRPIRPRDVMILVRRRTVLMEELVRALKLAGVPVAGMDRMLLTEQLAVMDLTALGAFLLLPEDDLTLATVLKGPFVAFDEETLFSLAYDRNESLWAALSRRRDECAAFRDAHRLLAGLLSEVDYRPPFELFASFLTAGGGRRALVARLGREVEDAIEEFLQLALGYQRDHPATLQGFLHWFGSGGTEVKRELDQGARDEVRVMTVHGSKGLQAPIVFLADTTGMPRREHRLFWVASEHSGEKVELPLWSPRKAMDDPVCAAARAEAEQAQDEEYRRLLYVAMTRAEDRLYVCGASGQAVPSDDCWYGVVRTALSSIAEPFDFNAVPGSWPGPHVPGPGLRLRGRLEGPAASAVPLQAAHTSLPLPDWALRDPPAEAEPIEPLRPSPPSLREPASRSPLTGGDGKRFLRGLIVHRLLQTLPELPVASRRVAAENYLARPVHDLSPAAARAILDETMAILEEPGLAALFGPDSQAEVPLVGLLGTRAVAGQVDRLLLTPERTVIVDYKTMRPVPPNVGATPVAYLRQMASYRALLSRIHPGPPIACVLLWTDGPRMMEIPDDLLDRHAPDAS